MIEKRLLFSIAWRLSSARCLGATASAQIRQVSKKSKAGLMRPAIHSIAILLYGLGDGFGGVGVFDAHDDDF